MTSNPTLPQRQGVILLLVLAMMTFFAILVAAFMLISSQQYREASTMRKIGEYTQSPRDDLHAAALELIVGSDSGDSEIGLYSLGATLYGDGTFVNTVRSVGSTNGLQSVSLQTSIPSDQVGNIVTLYNTAEKKWVSKRIVDFDSTGDNITAIYYPEDLTFAPVVGAELYINGPAFSGDGVPSTAIFPPDVTLKTALQSKGVMLNADYTAPDANNPFLAWIDKGIPSFGRFGTVSVVDNDGNGDKDSIWVRTSLPVRSTKDGRRYVPLVSYLVQDLDGRLNVNAHGNSEQQYTTPYDSSYDNNPKTDFDIFGHNQPAGNGYFGIGYGPAAVNLLDGLRTVDSGLSNADAIKIYEARYGADTVPGQDNSTTNFSSYNPVFENTVEQLQALEQYLYLYGGMAPDPWDTNVLSYDLLGFRSLFANSSGNGYERFWDNDPQVEWQKKWLDNVLFNNPYEFDPNHSTAYDEPFTLPELESILRMNDLDQHILPKRLRDIFVTGGADLSRVRQAITVISNDVPKKPMFRNADNTALFSLRERIRECVNLQSGSVSDVNTLMDYIEPYLTANGQLDPNILLTDSDVVNPANDAEYFQGLMKRAEFARAVYIVLMTLGYEQIYDDSVVINLDPNYQLDSSVAGNAQLCRELTAARLAQWAVNLVDFMDADATMTPFVFDVNPFDGWAALNYSDGTTLRTAIQATIPVPPAITSDVHLTWGLEPSDLLITEAIAIHDRRVADTNAKDAVKQDGTLYTNQKIVDGTPLTQQELEEQAKHDPDFDQVRIPEGSAFVELYCAANPHRPNYPSPLYNAAGNLNLNAMAGTSPAWRLVVGESTAPMGNSANPDAQKENNAVYRNLHFPATFTFQPEQYKGEYNTSSPMRRSSLLGTEPDILIDRIVWLANIAPTGGDSDRTFANMSGAVTLAPNEYLVVGPRLKTSIGSKNLSIGYYGTPADRALELVNGTYANKSIVAGKNVLPVTPTGPWAAPRSIGFSISEPLPLSGFYYDEPNYFNPAPVNPPLKDGYTNKWGDPSNGKDKPFEMPDGTTPGRPVSDDHLVFDEGTVPYYKSLFLQRVADPNRPYDSILNPYITVDWSMFDLTVFNGERDAAAEQYALRADGTGGTTRFLDLPPAGGAVLVSRQWGHKDMFGTGNIPVLPNPRSRFLSPKLKVGTVDEFEMELELPLSPNFAINSNDVTNSDFFRKAGHTTFGYLNEMAYKGGTTSPNGGLDAPYKGAPNIAFLHLPWNDSPLANPYEVMQVPASTPGRFGVEFVDHGVPPGIVTDVVKNPYEASPLGTDTRFRHLLNFFSDSMNLAGFLDCVSIPSRFLGTRDWYDVYGDAYSVSREREPGKINLNTMTEPAFEALMGGRTHLSYADFDDARWSNGWFRGTLSSPIDGTILREKNSGDGYPLFTEEPPLDPVELDKYLKGTGANTYNALEGIQRLSSMTTTTSNVFAVWMTLGYFEADNNGALRKDLTTGEYLELGSDTGDITRHRAFYIIDRSIPFGYQRGKKLNAEDTILLKRFIE